MTASEQRELIQLSASLAARDGSAMRATMETCSGMMPTEVVEEVILQSYLFLGYPLALNAFGVWREVSGVHPPDPQREDWGGWADRGSLVCSVVYGGQYEGLRRNVRELHPDMERWMVVEGYGKVLGRPGLDLVTRELCIIALLAVLDAPKQLYSHLRGALNAGASFRDVDEALGVAFPWLDEGGIGVVTDTWARVRARRADPREES